MRAADRRTASLLLLAAACAATTSGCWPFTRGDEPGTFVAGPRMSGVEARSLLAQARERLHANRAGDMWTALDLANDVIARCDTPRQVWDAYLVKATAFESAGYPLAAARAARQGIGAFLGAGAEAPAGSAETALKMLLPLYVESAAAAREYEDPHKSLAEWKADLLARYAPASPAGATMREEFDLLEKMTDQLLSAHEPDTLILRAVQQFILALNSRDGGALCRLADTACPFGKRLAAQGPAAVLSAGIDRVYLASSVKAESRPAGGAAAPVTAACALVLVSPQGWARLVEPVKFQFTRTSAGEWRVCDVSGLP